ncbi:hypothetical protein SAMN05216525_16813 [Bradyrhizobium sp. Gha]|nr:hypothetical protein SAMN05216525_16813 [Bradyrhizobium sp. Gha]
MSTGPGAQLRMGAATRAGLPASFVAAMIYGQALNAALFRAPRSVMPLHPSHDPHAFGSPAPVVARV